MEYILSLVVAAYGAYVLYTGNASGLSPIQALQGISALVGGLGYFVYLNRSVIKSFFSGVVTSRVTTKVEKSNANAIFNPNDYEQKDFECLVHLRNRVTAANSAEGIETCAKLNEIIFSLETANKVSNLKQNANLGVK